MSAVKRILDEAPVAKARDRESTELSLLTAAGAVFGKKGYENATTREIADQAGCAEALIHRYFGGKNGLLLAVVKHGMLKTPTIDIAALPFKNSVEEEVLQIFDATAENLKSRAEHIKIVFSRALIDTSFEDFKKIVMRPERLAIVEKRLKRYQDDGLIDASVHLAGATEMLLGLIFQLSFVHREIMGISKTEYEAKVASFSEIFSHGITLKTKNAKK